MKRVPAFVILTVITLVAAVLLALTDSVTRGPIQEAATAAAHAARFAVLPGAEDFEKVEDAEGVESLYTALADGKVMGSVAAAKVQGFAGPIEVTVGMDTEGKLTGISVGGEGFAETPGLGTKVQEPAFTDLFIGKSAPVVLGETVDAISGATVTSRAVVDAVNNAARAMGVDVPEAQGPEVVMKNGVASTVMQGFAGPVEVGVDVDADGKIISVAVGGEGFVETPGFGTKAQEPAFTDLFVGQTAPVNVDAISGATVTSVAVIGGVDAVLEAVAGGTVKEASEEVSAEAPVVEEKSENAETAPATESSLSSVSAVKTVATTVQGFAGPVEVIVLLDAEDKILEVTVGGEGFVETPGFGTKAQEPAFTDLFVGQTAPVSVDVISGATVTSQAVIDGVNDAFAVANVEEAPAEVSLKAEEAAAVGAVTTIATTVQGFAGPVEVIVLLDAEDKILEVTVGGEGFVETPGFGTKAQEPAFTDLFVGQTAPVSVDVISGATVTSQAVIDGVNDAFAVVNVEEAPAEVSSEMEEAQTDENTAVVTVQGFSGRFDVTVVLDAEGKVAAVEVDGKPFPETGLGREVQHPSFTDLFVGQTAPVSVDTIAGATVSSQAVIDGVNQALEAVSGAEASGAGDAKTATDSAAGFAGPVQATVTVDANGEIIALEIGGEKFAETEGFGTKLKEEAFTAQFLGKKAPFAMADIDAISGATVSTEAALAAINGAYASLQK